MFIKDNHGFPIREPHMEKADEFMKTRNDYQNRASCRNSYALLHAFEKHVDYLECMKTTDEIFKRIIEQQKSIEENYEKNKERYDAVIEKIYEENRNLRASSQ